MDHETTRLSTTTTAAYARLRGEVANLDEDEVAKHPITKPSNSTPKRLLANMSSCPTAPP